jgi:hypothetical protein
MPKLWLFLFLFYIEILEKAHLFIKLYNKPNLRAKTEITDYEERYQFKEGDPFYFLLVASPLY